MATAVEQGRRSRRRMPKITNGRFYAACATIVFVVAQICQTVAQVAGR